VRVLIDYRSALRGRSGVGEYVHQLVMALRALALDRGVDRRLEVTVFSSSWKDRLQLPAELRSLVTIDRRVPVFLLNLAWHRLAWPPVELLARGSFDVAHSLHPLMMPARRAARVVTIHDLNFLAHPERTRGEIRRDYPRLTRRHAHAADRVIVPSAFTAAEVERLLEVPRSRISICSPGAPDWQPRRSRPQEGYILFLGTLEPRKNVGVLLDAYEQLIASGGPCPPLVLAGQATAESKPWLDRLARPPLAGRASHIGYVDPADRRRVYEGARLLVQPSFEEGFGIPVLEAMTLGVPVVAANRGALPEVLGDAGLLVEPHDAAQIASAIRRVLDDEGLSMTCGSRGTARARQFRWSTTAERVFEAYGLAIACQRLRGGSR
jgi:glycosyltransferase involved in cell wall biosynthesis